jgi:hypothetical protein
MICPEFIFVNVNQKIIENKAWEQPDYEFDLKRSSDAETEK